MIRYALACEDGHRFESWFRDSAAYDQQREQTRVVCPVCGSTAIAKTIMAPAVVGVRAAEPSRAPANAAPDAPVEVALVDDKSRELRAMIRAVRDKVFSEAQDVGPRFALEARRMHDGEIPERRIYGQASVGEARDLLEDGILVMPLPNLPDDLN